MMFRTLFLVLSLVVVSSCSVRFNRSFYGNESARPPFADNSINLFIDGAGYVYPSYPLDKSVFFNSRAPLLMNYYTNSEEYPNLLEAYDVKPDDDIISTMETLNTAVKQQWLASANEQLADFDRVFVLVHGYNNTYRELIGPYSLFQNRIDANTETKNFFINVFWDGLTDNKAKSLYKGETIYYTETGGARAGVNNLKIWRSAQHQALFAGMELRTILSGLDMEELTLISHSLGARVIASALFDITPEDDWKKLTVAQSRYLTKIRAAERVPAPRQKISIGMMAPAIGGKETFDDYFETKDARSAADSTNYRFTIGFNENDIVLRKYNLFGKKSANMLGDTSLGTLQSDIDEVQTLFTRNNKPAEQLQVVDFSKTYDAYPQDRHGMIYYLDNPHFETFLQKVLSSHE